MVGEIWPDVTVEFCIVFKPVTATLYQQTLYCDITGCESPLCLTIKGEGLGPKLEPSYNVMDMRNICIGDKDWYEVTLANKGLIDAPFKMSSPNTTFGHFFSFSPVEDVVPPGACQTVKVTFSSSVLGTFSEDLLLSVKGQPHPRVLNFRGCVIAPTFDFDVTELNFGDVAFGFPQTAICTLFNRSFVPLSFSLHVLGDGLGHPSVSCVEQVNDKLKSQWQGCTAKDRYLRPKEFTVHPESDCVPAMSRITIKVTLCSNTVKRYRLALAVDVEGVGKEIKTLPLNARCTVPCLETRCWSRIPQYILRVSYLEVYFAPQLRGTSSMCVAKAVGRLHCTMRIAVFGSTQPPLDIMLSCIGQGPIVRFQNNHLDFGKIPVLKDVTKSLYLLNQSPIPAHFSLSMRQRKSFWSVDPREGEVPAEGQLELRVVAHLRDTLDFEDKLDVFVQDCGTLTVPVNGRGTGITIVSDKPFAPSIDLGTHFSHGLYQYHFKLTNLGLRTHRMYWRTDGFLNKAQKRGSMGSSRVEKPVFSLNPSRVELFPGQSVDMLLTGSCNTSMVVNERLVCHSIVGNTGSCDCLMTVDISCCFVAPMLSISPNQLHFYLEKVPGKSILPQYKKLLLKNVSTLTLFMDLQTAEPFFLCHGQDSPSSDTAKMMVLDKGRHAELWVCLNPGFCEDQVSRVLDEFLKINYQGHPQQDIVALHGEIHFPNLLLSSTSVDFGCVLNSTEIQREITITNCSPLPVAYRWTFLDQKPTIPRGAESLLLEDEKKHSTEVNTLSSASLLSFSSVSSDSEQRITYCPVKVEEMFDVLPIYGHLQPGEQQCHVEDGPVYEVTLKGEASQISFNLDYTCVDFGQKLFDHVGEAEVILKNSGRVGFDFKVWSFDQNENANQEPSENVLDMHSSQENLKLNIDDIEIIPGQPLVFPSKGYVEAGTATILHVLYLPGVPEKFEKRLWLQVACLPPQEIKVIGEGVFPRVILNLPRKFSQDCYSNLVKQAKVTVKTNGQVEEVTNESKAEDATEASYIPTNKELLEMEIERILVKENALSVTSSCLEFKEQGRLRRWSRLSKCLLPEYVLDFGSVILGRAPSQTLHISNNGSVTVSLTVNHKVLTCTGFNIEFEKVKNLSCGETHSFTVMFDPQGAKLPLGSVCVVLPIQVRGGPTVQVHLCAVVTRPNLVVSTETLEFDTIPCGSCQMKTVQLFNPESVPCKWSIAEEVKLKKVNKFLPFYKRKQQPSPVVFQMLPSAGVLTPGERANVRVKFTPLEEGFYSKHLVVSVAESNEKVLITAQGEGEEPQLEFCPSVMQLGPCLPFTTEMEAEVVVKNPCSFPIEFYCLELDKQYIEEEKILRLMQGYDENNRLSLPPRIAGEGLPQELLDFYQHYSMDKADNNTECDIQIRPTESLENKRPSTALDKTLFLLSELNRDGLRKELGQLLLDPVCRALARHMGVDLSPDSLAAYNRRGIAIIVYGAPKTDTRSTAVSLTQYYGATLLSINAVVSEALLRGTSPAAMTARHLLEQAAAEYSKSVGNTLASLEKTKDLGSEILDNNSSSSCNGEPTDTETTQIALCLGGDITSLKTLLPEPVLTDILSERFQSSDCRCGIVIDGLKSVFTATVSHTLQVVLKAINNRKHIYVVNMFDSYSALQNREKAEQNAKECQQREMAENEKQWLQELDEEEYEALPEERKSIIAQHRQRLTQDQIRLAKEQDRQHEDLKRLKEEELKKNNKKDSKKEIQKEIPKKKLLEVKMSNEKLNRKMSGETLRETRDVSISKEGPSNLLINKDHNDQQHYEEATLLQRESPANTEKLDRYKSSMNELQIEFLAFEQKEVALEKTPIGKSKGKKANYKGPKCAPIETSEDKLCPVDVIPHLIINVEKHCSVIDILIRNPLPSLEEVLDELELGPNGPPIPPSVTFSLVSFPKNRTSTQLNSEYFTFLVPSENDDQSDERKEEEEDIPIAPVKPKVPTKGRDRSAVKESQPAKDKDKKVKETPKGKRKTSAKTKPMESSRNTSHTSLTSLSSEDQQHVSVELKRNQRHEKNLTNFRWTVPSNGEVILKIWFYSETPGIFEHKFNFEMAGNQTQWDLSCKGICTYPTISKDFMTLFAYSKKAEHEEINLHKTYIIKPGYFEFGPLLCSKTRDRYKENKYPDNTERLVIHNISGMEAEINFSFQNDTQAATYLLEPPTMTLKPDEKQELMIWAYPTKVEQIKDSIVCHIKDNPEPVVIKVSCWGVRPELQLDTKNLIFDRTVIHRRVSRTVNLHNDTAFPVFWKLQGIDDQGGLFCVQDQGTIQPKSDFSLTLHVRSKRPCLIKKVLRLEVSDVEKILGIVHTENISVSAEVYDVALDIDPACLEFGTIKVFDEAKSTLRIRNQGKYEVAYRLYSKKPNLDFTFSPQSGKILHDKYVTVQIFCKPKTELNIREQPILACEVIEANLEGKSDPPLVHTQVSVQAVFSRYKITPACDINFGPLVFGGKKTLSFIIENTGVFETRFSIHPMITGYEGSGKKKPHLDSSSRLTIPGSKVKPEYMQKDMSTTQTQMTLGVFSMYPCTAVVLPGSQQVVTVDCSGDQLGRWNQGLLIDICDRDPSDHPDGIPYRLLAEVYKTGIVSDPSSIFEEHFLCHNSHQLSSEQFANAETIYVTEENKFIFNKVLVGQTTKARFKLTNNTKIPCSLNFTIRNIGPKMEKSTLLEDIFHLSPTSLTLSSQSHSFTEVTFNPLVMTTYHGVFEAFMDEANRTMPTHKSKVLEFDILGEGTLPNVCVIKPALKNSSGDPLLQFRRSLIGQRKTQSLVLLNDGNAPAQVQIDMPDKDGVFSLSAAQGNNCSSISTVMLENSSDPDSQSAYRAITKLNVLEKIEFEVSFCSKKAQKFHTKMYLNDSKCKKITVFITGEAFQEMISLENIRRPLPETDVMDGNYEVVDFGDCHVDVTYQESFTMTNHSKDKVLRFEWLPAGPQVSFSPQIGHLHAGCSKELVVLFRSSQPISLSSKPMKCKVTQVVFKDPLEQVLDWDDRQKTLPWTTACKPASAAPSPQPANNKVIKADPELNCSVVDGWHLDLELRINAVCDYAKFSCSTHTINFKDTMLYQTRLQKLQISNEGNVALAFSWKVQIDHGQTDESLTSRPSSGSLNSSIRPSSATENVLSLLSINPKLNPFTVDPCIGIIKPHATQEFNICFSPLEVSQFDGILLCSIPNLQKKDQSPTISVRGHSIMPDCHFDVEESDYISGRRRNPEFRRPLDPNTRVVEFIAVGLSAKSTKRFFVLNPTNKPYSFKWRCEDSNGSPFLCLTPSGILQPKEKAEVHLEYASDQMDVVESSWSFVIDNLSVSVPFLFVGTTRAPLIYLDKALINFKDLLLGTKAEQTINLVSGEEEPFHFSVLESSLLCEDQLSSLVMHPMSGSLEPKERCQLSISFTPNRQGYLSFRVFLKVKRMLEPLALTVKAECFSLDALVQVEQPSGCLRELRPNHIDCIDFERVGISEQSSFRFLVSNLAKCKLDITCDIAGPTNQLQHLKAEPKHATLEVGKQLQISIFFCPLNICNLQDVKLSIMVKNGAAFTLDVKGKGTAPSLDFSFTKHNFGKCFVHSRRIITPTQTLVIRNKDKRDISVQCNFKKTSDLEIDFQPRILTSGADLKIPITFSPQETRRYQEMLDFILNGCVTRQVEILGQGIEMRLEVEDPKHRRINFGSLTIGRKVKKRVVLVNRSTVNLSFSLNFNCNTPLDPKDLSVTPTGQINLKTGESCAAEIQFTPQQHVPKFIVELQAETLCLLHPLLSVTGSCQGVEVHLDQNQLAFGAVVQHCKTSRKVVMINTGDIDGKFCWKTENFPPSLKISPAKGIIGSRMEVPFEVIFAPVQLSNDSRFENLSCIVEGRSSPLTLTVTGSCVPASTNKEVVNFICPVRRSHTQSLPVLNPTNQSCSIRPVIKGEQWTSAPAIEFEPLQNKMIEITYSPLTMTSEGNKHLGSMFFSFPDGTGLLYSLQGTAEAPQAEDTIVLELPAKTQHTQLLSVYNWLLKPQRFCVSLEIVKPEKSDATVSLSGLHFIDVPALTKRNYKLSFFTYKMGQYNTKVTFRSEVSGEYLFYLVTFKATTSQVLSTIELVTTVRQMVSGTVHIENPLPTNVSLTSECKCSDISVPLQHTVPRQSKDPLNFEYLPLQAGETTARLTLSSNELGYFHYDLLLRALPPPMEKTVHFTASLGTNHSVIVKFTNFSRSKTVYSCKTDCPDFFVDKSVTAVAGFQAGSEASVEVCFEPHQLGEVRALLTLSSPAGGAYVFPLYGNCQRPKAQGPFSISSGRVVPIPFKNVFLQSTSFSYQVDNQSFTVKGSETINSKATQNVLVSFEPPPGGGSGPWFGYLTISTQPTKVQTEPYSWVFFLKGYRPVSS
ncbi:hypothetical protein WMY93_023911 [Mugilogobius chulae]|uniref:Hydrocephalus-inducing protein homolog n=1 Tax=Mugilogobius chulae TaxID=88201 RepID=A0AAW0NAJ0_9GOBI